PQTDASSGRSDRPRPGRGGKVFEMMHDWRVEANGRRIHQGCPADCMRLVHVLRGDDDVNCADPLPPLLQSVAGLKVQVVASIMFGHTHSNSIDGQ
ncbi:MAG: hypothetical protein ABGY75_08130, partial [Gemmataceae bacterium]